MISSPTGRRGDQGAGDRSNLACREAGASRIPRGFFAFFVRGRQHVRVRACAPAHIVVARIELGFVIASKRSEQPGESFMTPFLQFRMKIASALSLVLLLVFFSATDKYWKDANMRADNFTVAD
jgi:hypothetical protein